MEIQGAALKGDTTTLFSFQTLPLRDKKQQKASAWKLSRSFHREDAVKVFQLPPGWIRTSCPGWILHLITSDLLQLHMGSVTAHPFCCITSWEKRSIITEARFLSCQETEGVNPRAVLLYIITVKNSGSFSILPKFMHLGAAEAGVLQQEAAPKQLTPQ